MRFRLEENGDEVLLVVALDRQEAAQLIGELATFLSGADGDKPLALPAPLTPPAGVEKLSTEPSISGGTARTLDEVVPGWRARFPSGRVQTRGPGVVVAFGHMPDEEVRQLHETIASVAASDEITSRQRHELKRSLRRLTDYLAGV